MDEAAKKVLSALETLCSKQECCSRDIYAKALKRLEGDAQAAAEVMQSLTEDKYVDDARYAAAFAREKAAITGWGPIKIKYALAAKGITGDAVKDALAEIDPERSEEKLRRILENKWRTSLNGEKDGKFRLIKFALTRGYEYDQVRDLVEEICKS